MALCARDVMRSKVHTVRPDLSVPDLEREFLKDRVTGFPVVEGERLVGVVSRSDVVRKLAAEQSMAEYVSDYYRKVGGFDEDQPDESLAQVATRAGSRLGSATVSDVMSRSPVNVAPDASIREVSRLLVDRKIHRVLVATDGRLEGIITSMDLVALIADGRLGPD